MNNHLGNVLATVSDRRIQVDANSDGTVDTYKADIVSANDYYPGGMQMPGRKYSIANTNYRFGFNGQEKSTEINADGNSTTAEFWQYDSRLVRRWNVDPKPDIGFSPYSVFKNNPIWFFDILGDSITPGQLKAIFPKGNSEILNRLGNLVNTNQSTYGLDNNKSLAQFLAQSGYETGGFKKASVTENLNYKTLSVLEKTFKKYFSKISGRKAQDYLNNPEKLANVTYSNRMGNGNEDSGDGYKYRGRGALQMTGKNNYIAFSKFYQSTYDSKDDFVTTPDKIADDMDLSILSAFWYYKVYVVDATDIQKASVEKVTILINGGLNGLEGRKNLYNKAIKILDESTSKPQAKK